MAFLVTFLTSRVSAIGVRTAGAGIPDRRRWGFRYRLYGSQWSRAVPIRPLAQDIRIQVTSFYRDPEDFADLNAVIIPVLWTKHLG